jgi:hypothetical protein
VIWFSSANSALAALTGGIFFGIFQKYDDHAAILGMAFLIGFG